VKMLGLIKLLSQVIKLSYKGHFGLHHFTFSRVCKRGQRMCKCQEDKVKSCKPILMTSKPDDD
jgi:hypothetical protein